MPSKYTVRAEKITTESSDSKSFIFTPIDNDEGLYDYLPGQFFMVEAKITRPESIVYDKESKQMIPSGPDVEVVEKKAYSVVSSPTQKGHVELMIKSEQGVFAPYLLDQFHEGDTCTLVGPTGKFMKEIFDQNSKFIACWSAGSGIPSTLSLMQYCLDNQLDTKVVAFDSNKTRDDIIYHDKIKEMVSKSEHFKAVFTATRQPLDQLPKSTSDVIYESGRFWTDENSLAKHTDNRGFLDKLLGKKSNWLEYFNTICGSSSFINGKGRDKAGKMAKLGEGVEDHLLKFECTPSNIDKDQYYLQ